MTTTSPREAWVDTFLRASAETSDARLVADQFIAAGWRPPVPAAQVEIDEEADAWYVRVLDVDVHHTTESAPVNLDWTRDGQLIGVELLGPLKHTPSPLPETEKAAAELRRLADQLDARGHQRDEIGDDDPSEDDTCAEEGLDCHTVAAVATWFRAALMLRRRADELSPAQEVTS